MSDQPALPLLADVQGNMPSESQMRYVKVVFGPVLLRQ